MQFIGSSVFTAPMATLPPLRSTGPGSETLSAFLSEPWLPTRIFPLMFRCVSVYRKLDAYWKDNAKRYLWHPPKTNLPPPPSLSFTHHVSKPRARNFHTKKLSLPPFHVSDHDPRKTNNGSGARNHEGGEGGLGKINWISWDFWFWKLWLLGPPQSLALLKASIFPHSLNLMAFWAPTHRAFMKKKKI